MSLKTENTQFLTALNQVVLQDIKKIFEGNNWDANNYWNLPASLWNSTIVITLMDMLTHFVKRVSLQQVLPGGYSSCTNVLSIEASRPVDAILLEIFLSFSLFQRTTNLGDLFVGTSGLENKGRKM